MQGLEARVHELEEAIAHIHAALTHTQQLLEQTIQIRHLERIARDFTLHTGQGMPIPEEENEGNKLNISTPRNNPFHGVKWTRQVKLEVREDPCCAVKCPGEPELPNDIDPEYKKCSHV